MTGAQDDAIVEASERFGYRDEAPGISTPPGMRMNKSVHWVADTPLLGPLFERMSHLLPPRIDGAHLFPEHVTWIGFRRGRLLRGYMFEFMRCKPVDQVASIRPVPLPCRTSAIATARRRSS